MGRCDHCRRVQGGWYMGFLRIAGTLWQCDHRHLRQADARNCAVRASWDAAYRVEHELTPEKTREGRLFDA